MILALTLLLFAALLWLAVCDFKTYRLPDILTLPLIAIGLIIAYLWLPNWSDHIIGAALGYGGCVALELSYKYWRGRDGLGRGDAKLLAAGGAWCGWAGLPFIILIGSGSALIALLFPSFRMKTEAGMLPFGPFLALGIALVWAAQYLS